ncbi:MAG TPA: hypothetical protein P5279_03635 [Anaerohalosphaeraceae bacterium]|jgi:hypothetical protein|nr:hypothetical protein [Anaerohalosphaeraceae bacterium]HRT49561.1 hypothetical protein [Anaerohalosphaeraceae bacterium]HRT85504.1 hypothetical protein [Anaerohalosphaeraceae bacterium]
MVSKAVVKWLALGLALAVFGGCGNGTATDWGSTSDVPAANGHEEVIAADCTVTFFQVAGNGEYFSTQQHRINPVSKSILIEAREPQGQFSWRLSAEGYASQIPSAARETAPAAAIDRDVVRAISACFAAAAGYYDLGAARALEKVKIDGRWYEPFELPAVPENGQVTLFRLPDEGRIDLVRVNSGGRTVTAHGYNYHWLDEVGRYVPSKIDVSVQSSVTGPSVRVLRIDYKSFNVLKRDN